MHAYVRSSRSIRQAGRACHSAGLRTREADRVPGECAGHLTRAVPYRGISFMKSPTGDGVGSANRRRSDAWRSRSVNGRDSRMAYPQETRVDTQPRMDDEQERMRLDGLRVLARIIARHALAHPHLYRNDPAGDPAAAPTTGGNATATEPAEKDGAA